MFRGNFCRLPGDGLPFVVAFYERAGIEVVRYFGRALFFGGGDQTKSDDRSVAVLQDADVFGAVSGDTFVWFLRRGRFRFHVAKDIGFAEALAGGTGVNEFIRPEPLVHGQVVAPGAIEKFLKSCFKASPSGAMADGEADGSASTRMVESKSTKSVKAFMNAVIPVFRRNVKI